MTGEVDEALKTGIAPIVGVNSRLLILGSLPGDVSLSRQRYYAHPTNQFWRLLGAAVGEELQALDYAARLEALALRRVGLWDVIGSARRRGSLDQSIRAARRNPLRALVQELPELRAIAFNGRAAADAGRRELGEAHAAITLIDLPSSSAAHTIPVQQKAKCWAVLGEFCG